MEQSTRRSVLRGVGAATTSGVGIAAASERGAAETFDEFGVYVYVAWLEEGDWLPEFADHAREVARKKPVHTVYPMIPTTVMPSGAKEKWFDFVEDVHGYGVDVVPTVGGGGGGVTADNAESSVSQILTWDEDAPYGAKIDGLQVDVESEAYDGDVEKMLSEIAELHDRTQDFFDLSGIRYSVAVAGYWQDYHHWDDVVEHSAVDHVNLMAYGGENGGGGTVDYVVNACDAMRNVSTAWELVVGLHVIDGTVEYATGSFTDQVLNQLDNCWWNCVSPPVRVSAWHADDITV